MIKNYIDAAISRIECDLVLKNAQYVDVFGGKIRKGDIGVLGDKIVGVGAYHGREEYDVSGCFVLPGFIDSHVHIESSQLSPEGFASLVLPRGTTTVIADPHEITNVCGKAGLEYIIRASANTPLDVKIMLPSCVPATPFETSGATLSGEETAELIGNENIFGLGEFMNFPAVISGKKDALLKLSSASAAGKPIDGHAPSLKGKKLNAYLCGGITTDHECTDKREIEEKLSKGTYIALRHGSTARNLQENCKSVKAGNMRRFTICTDDRHASDIARFGHIDDALRTAVLAGLKPVYAVTMATLNAAECYGLKKRGAIAPDWFADMVVVDNLAEFNARLVFKNGKLVGRDKQPVYERGENYLPPEVLNTVKLKEVSADEFKIKLKGAKAKALTVKGGSIVTGCEVVEIPSLNDDVVIADANVLKLAVVERHKLTGNVGLGLIKGYGFHGGALGVTISHDSHNVIIIGDENRSMAKVAAELRRIGGGMAVYDRREGQMLSVPLDIGGLMSSAPPEEFIERSDKLYARALVMGVKPDLDAFLSLAFLSLAVVPHLKLTDKGLFDVDKFSFTDINAE